MTVREPHRESDSSQRIETFPFETQEKHIKRSIDRESDRRKQGLELFAQI